MAKIVDPHIKKTDRVGLTKEDMWTAWREAWNIADSMDSMTKLEKRTARRHFETWWESNYDERSTEVSRNE